MVAYIHVNEHVHVHVSCDVCIYMYLDLSVRDRVLSKTRSVKGHPVLVVIQIYSFYSTSVKPTLTLSVQSCCAGGRERERERVREREAGIYVHVK